MSCNRTPCGSAEALFAALKDSLASTTVGRLLAILSMAGTAMTPTRGTVALTKPLYSPSSTNSSTDCSRAPYVAPKPRSAARVAIGLLRIVSSMSLLRRVTTEELAVNGALSALVEASAPNAPVKGRPAPIALPIVRAYRSTMFCGAISP